MSIKVKAAILVTIISFLFTTAFTVIFYQFQKKMIIEQIVDKLETAAYAIEEIIPQDYFDRARSKNAISEKEYDKYLFELTKYAKKVGVYYLYTFVIIHGKKYFTATSMTDKEYRTGTYDRYFTEYPYNKNITEKAAKAKKPMVIEISDPKYGHFLTVYIPRWTKKGHKYYLGADMNITEVRRELKRNLFTCIFIGLILFTLSILSGMWVANQLSDPILKLSRYAENIIDDKLIYKAGLENVLQDIIKRKDEIGRLAKSFDIMEKKLESYIINLKKTTAAKERIESELKIAHNIQMGFLPKKLDENKIKEIELSAAMYPAKEVGGDLYDYFISGKKLYFIIGDVSGKGVPAALFMSTTITLFRAFAPVSKTPSEILFKVNNEIVQINDSMSFVTLICGILDITTGELIYSNAGHLYPYVIKKDGDVKIVNLPEGLVAGIMKDFKFKDLSLTLNKEDMVLFYTDGVTEAFNKENEIFGDKRLEDLLKSKKFYKSEDVLITVRDAVFDFSKGVPQADDITILVIKKC